MFFIVHQIDCLSPQSQTTSKSIKKISKIFLSINFRMNCQIPKCVTWVVCQYCEDPSQTNSKEADISIWCNILVMLLYSNVYKHVTMKSIWIQEQKNMRSNFSNVVIKNLVSLAYWHGKLLKNKAFVMCCHFIELLIAYMVYR